MGSIPKQYSDGGNYGYFGGLFGEKTNDKALSLITKIIERCFLFIWWKNQLESIGFDEKIKYTLIVKMVKYEENAFITHQRVHQLIKIKLINMENDHSVIIGVDMMILEKKANIKRAKNIWWLMIYKEQICNV